MAAKSVKIQQRISNIPTRWTADLLGSETPNHSGDIAVFEALASHEVIQVSFDTGGELGYYPLPHRIQDILLAVETNTDDSIPTVDELPGFPAQPYGLGLAKAYAAAYNASAFEADAIAWGSVAAKQLDSLTGEIISLRASGAGRIGHASMAELENVLVPAYWADIMALASTVLHLPGNRTIRIQCRPNNSAFEAAVSSFRSARGSGAVLHSGFGSTGMTTLRSMVGQPSVEFKGEDALFLAVLLEKHSGGSPAKVEIPRAFQGALSLYGWKEVSVAAVRAAIYLGLLEVKPTKSADLSFDVKVEYDTAMTGDVERIVAYTGYLNGMPITETINTVTQGNDTTSTATGRRIVKTPSVTATIPMITSPGNNFTAWQLKGLERMLRIYPSADKSIRLEGTSVPGAKSYFLRDLLPTPPKYAGGR